MQALADAVSAGQLPKLAIEKLDGDAVIGSGHEEALIGAGLQPAGRRKTDRLGLNAPVGVVKRRGRISNQADLVQPADN